MEGDVEEIDDGKSGEAVCSHHEENYSIQRRFINDMQMQLSICEISFQIDWVDACNSCMVIDQWKAKHISYI